MSSLSSGNEYFQTTHPPNHDAVILKWSLIKITKLKNKYHEELKSKFKNENNEKYNKSDNKKRRRKN